MDVFSIPDFTCADIKIYIAQENTIFSDSRERIWTKPIGKTMATFIMFAGGGGGGGGAGAAGGAGKGGGGGGGSGSFSVYQIPLLLLPDKLYMVPGTGGAAGAGGSSGNGTAGSAGVDSRVLVFYNSATPAQNYYFLAGGGGGGGGAGTTAAGGAGGAAGTANSASTSPLCRWGYIFSHAGLAGSAGGFAAVGGDVTPNTGNIPIDSGTGGAGCTTTTFAGGNILAVSSTPWSQSDGGAAGAGPGNSGFTWANLALAGLLPSYVLGGTGGGSSNTVTGGAGGSAGVNAPGAGGGGGGGGVTVGGAGGRGGDGRIVVICH